jgi:hypothetical protein
LLDIHAQEIAAYLLPPVGLELARNDPAKARQLAVQAAVYALAAFDPQDAFDASTVRGILMTTHMALRPGHSDALTRYMQAAAAAHVKLLEQRQVRMRMYGAPHIPGRRRKAPRRLAAPPVVPLPDGVAHWLDLITDPALRRRLEPVLW